MENNHNVNECIICEKVLDSNSVKVTLGLETIKTASIRREDGIYEKIKDLEYLEVHKICRREYTREKSIVSAIKKREVETKIDSTSNLRNKQAFDFKLHCFFCGLNAEPNKKLPVKYRDTVHSVETIELKNKILTHCGEKSDSFSNTIYTRLCNIGDLVAVEGKYHDSCYKSFFGKSTGNEPGSSGRKPDYPKMRAFNALCEYLENNEECQYTMDEIINKLKEIDSSSIYTEKTVKYKLIEKFGENVIITPRNRLSPIVTFRMNIGSILTKQFYEGKINKPEEEKRRIIATAAAIIREDIREMVYDCENYPSFENFEDIATNQSPETLNFLLKEIVIKGKKAESFFEKKCLFIAHAIVSATRPRSFISNIQLGLSVFLHKKFGSKFLINTLSTLGACSTYTSAQLFEEASIKCYDHEISGDYFCQFIFDNADFNINTLDGNNTFHAMGGIQSITPKDSVSVNSHLPVLKKSKGVVEVGSFGNIPYKFFRKKNSSSLSNIIVEDLNSLKFMEQNVTKLQPLDALWVCGPWLELSSILNWSGLMSLAFNSNESDFSVSYIKTLPFLNMNPSDLSTIYSTLHFALEESRKQNMDYCIVTFDQPLYQKAFEIVQSSPELANVTLRLGGFHLLMSFLGTIGHIMSGSGLEDVLELVYAKNTVPHILNGHAFSRAIRAHMIVQWALFSHIIKVETTEFSEIDKEILKSDYINLHREINSDELKLFTNKINDILEHKQKHSRTSKLWVQYIKQVNIIHSFIKAERTGNFDMHLQCVLEMIPFFHASGHQNYAKSSHLYVQTMASLEKSLPQDTYKKFTSGAFTIRRTEKFWSGIWSDMTIEQTLMRSMKTSGGLTHGRGITPSTLTKWVKSTPVCEKVCTAIEDFAQVTTQSSEQHIELRESRVKTDLRDLTTILTWFEQHSPFYGVPVHLISISTGVSGEAINCDKVEDVASVSFQELTGKPFSEFHLRKKFKVQTLSQVKSVSTTRQDIAEINSQQLFNRILCTMKDENDLKIFFQYELSSYPMSLFNNGKLRKGEKASLLNYLAKENFSIELPETEACTFVIDGGKLLYKLVWPKLLTFGQLFRHYYNYVCNNYKGNVVIVFDGYSKPSIKDEEHRRRQIKFTPNIDFTENTPVTTTQLDFFLNKNNKTKFIAGLKNYFTQNNVSVLQAESDCDILVANTAIDNLSSGKNVITVADDTDIFILLLFFTQKKKYDSKLYMLHSGSTKSPDKYLDILKIADTLPPYILNNLLFIHSFTGCDSTSYPFKMGKKRIFRLLESNLQLSEDISIFNCSTTSKNDLCKVGEKVFLNFCSNPISDNLNEERYHCYKKIISKQGLGSNFDLSYLPPTKEAAAEHIFRVYLQIQFWKGNNLDPEEWGWRRQNNEYYPITSSKPPGPDHLMASFFCKCKNFCEGNCPCSAYRCSGLCKFCKGMSCRHSVQPEYSDLDIED